MELRTTMGKILLGMVGVALVVFVVVPWLQAPPPPASPASPDEIIQEVMGRPGENDGEAMDEADAVAGVLPEGEETVSPAPGSVAQPVEEGGEDQEVVGVLPAPLTPDEAVRDAVEAAVNQFAAAVLERLDEIVHASAGSPDAVVTASAPSVEEDETLGPAPQQVMEPVAPRRQGRRYPFGAEPVPALAGESEGAREGGAREAARRARGQPDGCGVGLGAQVPDGAVARHGRVVSGAEAGGSGQRQGLFRPGVCRQGGGRGDSGR